MPVAPVGHSEVGFSQAYRWLACPGSVEAQRGIPQDPSPAADQGTRLHEIAARYLESRDVDALNDLTADEADLVMPYIDTVLDHQRRLGAQLLVEQPFHLAHLHDQLWGTSDAVLIWQYAHEWWVQVYDLKTGGTPVDIRDHDGRINVQLSGYLLGGIQAATLAGHRPTRYRIAIVQPLRGGVKETIVERRELAELGADLVEGVERALTPGAPRFAGEHCQWCRAAPTCPELRAAAMAEITAFPTEDELESAPEADLLQALAALPTIKIWLKTVEGEAMRRLTTGVGLTGWKLVQKRGRRAWVDPAQAEQRLQGAGLDRDDIGSWSLMTPAQVAKIAKRFKLTIPLDELAPVKSSGATMAPASDPRPEVLPGTAYFEPEPEED